MRKLPAVQGPTVDDQTRCLHYADSTDVVAIRFPCCGDWYPCIRCHTESADHPPTRWPVARHGERAVLCGVCRAQLSITTYLAVSGCPHCAAPFNPRCRLHHHLYFDPPPDGTL